MQINRVALDLAKQVIQVHAVDRSGHALVRKSMRRSALLPFFEELAPCDVGMEACSSAHHWGRQLQAMGHRVRLLPPQYVKPFVLGQKNDANDAAAICAAMARQEIPTVQVKTIAQQDQQALHRIRSARVAQRTAPVSYTHLDVYKRQLLSLFVVPAFYALLAKYTHSPEELAHTLEKLEAETPQAGGHA